MDLVEFLRARLDEDEAEHWAIASIYIARHDPARVLREVEAKRRIVATAVLMLDGGVSYESWESVLQDLALPYSEHPDYRQEWKPSGELVGAAE